MSGKKYFECAICGKRYEACYSCGRKDASLAWKNLCDTVEHYKVFQVVNGYTSGVYTKEEAAQKLKNVDVSDVSLFRSNIKKIVKEIQGALKPRQAKVTVQQTIDAVQDKVVGETDMSANETTSDANMSANESVN